MTDAICLGKSFTLQERKIYITGTQLFSVCTFPLGFTPGKCPNLYCGLNLSLSLPLKHLQNSPTFVLWKFAKSSFQMLSPYTHAHTNVPL